ncbi:MAG: GyrI-like domain-containing protein [Lautropia sp.]
MTVPREARAEFTRRMNRVLDHIDRHLDGSLDLETLAAVAHFSPFHFHRLFAAWMGETLGDYLRRRRVESGAQRLLVQPQTAVLNVALSVGFGSAEAFARAFKQRFGAAPTAWRARMLASTDRGFGQTAAGDSGRPIERDHDRAERDPAPAERNPGQADRNPDQADRKAGRADPAEDPDHQPLLQPTSEEPTMIVKLIDREPARIAYLRHIGPYGAPILAFWQEAVYPWMVTNDLLSAPRYGIAHDDPQVTRAQQCRYDACIEVPAGFAPNGAAVIGEVPGGRYASCYFKGENTAIGDAWQAMFRDWLPASGFQLDGRPCIEYYGPGTSYDPKTGVFDCDLLVPVTPL